MLQFVKFRNLLLIDGVAKHLYAVIDARTHMHFKHDVKSLSAELPDTVYHREFQVDLFYDIVDVNIPGQIWCQGNTQMFVFATPVCNVSVEDEWKRVVDDLLEIFDI